MPWDANDSRFPEGKAAMREGISYYLGAHKSLSAKFLDVFTFNQSAIAVRYEKQSTGIHPQNKQAINYKQVFMSVLELETGKVAVYPQMSSVILCCEDWACAPSRYCDIYVSNMIACLRYKVDGDTLNCYRERSK